MSQPKRKKIAMNLARSRQTDFQNASEFQQLCLSTSVVLRTIISQLPTSDLLSCRLVSKCWYSEVNSVLMTLDVALKVSTDQPFEQVRQLIELIPNMSLPFNGLSFRKDTRQSIECEIPGNKTDLVSKFLQVLPTIKHLHFYESSASAGLIIQIMKSNSGNLEKISFDNSVSLPADILAAIVQLKKLKRIMPKKSSEFPESSSCVVSVHKIIWGCKSIEVVEEYTFDHVWAVPKSRFDLVKNLSLDSSHLWHPHEKLLKFIETKPKLESLTVVSKPFGYLQPPMMKQIIYDLVCSSKETLSSVEFSPYVWLLLARGLLYFEPLPRIRKLYKVPLNFSRMTPDLIGSFGGFIAYTFPNLKFIEVENVDFDEERAGTIYDVFANPNENYSLANSSVTSLKLVECQQLGVSLSAVILVAFPNVKNLNVSLRRGKLQSVYDLWSEGPDLQSLTISAQVKSRVEMESELLGIFPQEVRRLRELNLSPAQLKSLQIVPIRPALYHLTGLVKLSIKIRLGRTGIYLLQWNCEETRCGSNFDHNEIIKALSFGRMRSLEIAG